MRKLIPLLAVVMLTGCTVFEVQRHADAGAGALVKAEPVIVSLEDVTGAGLSPEITDRGAVIASRTAEVARRAAGVVTAAGAIPGPHTPFTVPVAGILGIVGTIAGAIAAFFERRKAARAKRAAAVVMSAVDGEPGIGAKIIEKTVAAGVADDVERIYRGEVK